MTHPLFVKKGGNGFASVFEEETRCLLPQISMVIVMETMLWYLSSSCGQCSREARNDFLCSHPKQTTRSIRHPTGPSPVISAVPNGRRWFHF
ncbi:hypothetical protein L195_g056535 [Trifolium pratense]|uniref:Uncharacterized protein n=1 Tax=Trifolium pratense TaxID=57577 RepID=A0A2K3KS40_TRIPR|nr:hypothetical protein L195_g056535 [Trifolium pratense]